MYKASGRANTVLYDNQPALVGAFSVIVQLRRLIVYSISIGPMALGSPSPTLAPPDLVPEVEPRHPGVGRVPLRHLHPALEEHLLGILDRDTFQLF